MKASILYIPYISKYSPKAYNKQILHGYKMKRKKKVYNSSEREKILISSEAGQ